MGQRFDSEKRVTMIPFLVALLLIATLVAAYYRGKYGELVSQWNHDLEVHEEERERLLKEQAKWEAMYAEEHDRNLARHGYKPILEKNQQPQLPSELGIEGIQGVLAKTRQRLNEHLNGMQAEEREALKEEVNG